MAGPEEPPISHDERPVGGGSNNAAFGEDEAGLPGPAAADQWKLAAINYNTKRVFGSAYDEEADGKLGSVYTALTEELVGRGDWRRMPALRNKETDEVKLPNSFHLLLGTAQGKGIRWGRLGYGMWPPPLVNYVRGFDVLTRKGKLVKTLAEASEATLGQPPADLPAALSTPAALVGAAWDFAPEAFVFHPSKGENNPTEALRDAYASRAGGPKAHNTWILKPSDGCKGNNITIVSELEEIEAHLAAEEAKAAAGEAVSSWVVQRYVSNPLLLEGGGRKFDMRCWVLLDAEYNIHLYRQGVLRTSAVAYDASDLSNRFAHLTNHCIAVEHAEYGKFEATNEMWFAQFDAELSRRFPEQAKAVGGSLLQGRLLPQIKRQVVQTLLAARERLEGSGDYYRPFHLFGYDFLVDSDLRVWLCEINASPAVAEHLLPAFVKSLVASAVDPFFPPVPELFKHELPTAEQAAAAAAARGEGFEKIYSSKAAPAAPAAAEP